MTAGQPGPLFIPWAIIIWAAVTFIAVPLLAGLVVVLVDRMRWWRLARRFRTRR